MKAVLMLQLWNPPPRFHLPFSISASTTTTISSTTQQQEFLTAKERRRLRNERRESKDTNNWKEEVEDKLSEKIKKEKKHWMDELNLDNLMKLGPQWWILRVSRTKGQYTAEALARSLMNNFPHMDFKVYAPAIHEKKRLKSGDISVKPKPLFPGCVFVQCELNKPLHDFIREYHGVGGFVGSKVGNTKRQINKPRPVPEDEIEAIFRQAKVEQENADKAFEESDVSKAIVDSKPKGGSRKTSNQLTITEESSPAIKSPKLAKGSTVRIISGTFSGFAGTLKKLSRKTKTATVQLTIFGKENIVDLDLSEIAPEIAPETN